MGEVLSMLRILIMLIVLVLLSVPFLPIRWPFSLCWFNFPEKKRPKNLIYIASTLLVILLTVLLMPYILQLAEWFRQLQFIVWLRSLVPNHALYSLDIFKAVFANVFFCLMVLLVHWLTGTLFGLFPKFSLDALKDAIRKSREERAAKKAAKKKAKAQKEETQEAPQDPSVLPPELKPEPEEKDFESILRFQAPDKVPAHKKKVSGKKKQKPQENDDTENGFSLKKWLLAGFAFFYVLGGDVW